MVAACSKARHAFDKNAKDIDRLLEIHEDYGGTGQGRRYQLDVLNKSAIALITACWEAYCEDLASEALLHIVQHAASADSLSKEIKQVVAKELRGEGQHQLASCLAACRQGVARPSSSAVRTTPDGAELQIEPPKSGNIDNLFMTALGIRDLSASWTWTNMRAEQARTKLDGYVLLRGEIAHRGRPQAAARSPRLPTTSDSSNAS